MKQIILAIDDDPLYLNLLRAYLGEKYQMLEAEDGEVGFQLAHQQLPDLVIVDVRMPNWDGLRTISEFRKDPELKNLPILILTADARRETILGCLDAGADDYLTKTSLTRQTLFQKLDLYLSEDLKPSFNPQQKPHFENSSTGNASTLDVLEHLVDSLDLGSIAQEIMDAWE